jgi:TRAP-type mannitol/chloroaromatic compound transport system substrate-binding protein
MEGNEGKKGGRDVTRRDFVKYASAGAALAAASTLPLVRKADASSSKPIHWKVSTCWPPSINLVDGDNYMVEIINKMSAGRLVLDFHAAGSIVGTTELFDTVRRGVLDAASDYPGYWTGKERALDFFFSFAMGMTPNGMIIWLYQGGGLELIQEIYAKHGMMYFPVGRAGMESGIRSNKPLRTAEDFKGVKIRLGTRPGQYIVKRLGGSPMAIAGGEVYTALERGTIDAAEFSMPSTDWGMGFQEVTKFWCLPGWYQPMWGGGWMINMKSWKALSDDLKEIVRVASMATGIYTYAKWEYESIAATRKFLEKGTKVTRLDQKTLDQIQQYANEYVEENAAKDPMFKKVAKSYYGFLKDFEEWRDMEQSGAFGFGRNLTSFPKI